VEHEQATVFEELSRDECLDWLDTEPVGRVAMTARALPVVLPVNFAVLNGEIVWRSTEGTKLNDASAGFVVAFEVDHFEPDTKQGWSVMVQGLAHVITDPDELGLAREARLAPWMLEGVADRYVRLAPTIITGTRVRQM